MTISERIFEKIIELKITQKRFCELTGIKQTTVSEWKKKKTNPSSDKILAICKVLDVSPEWLLSGVDPAASREKNRDYYVVDVATDTGILISSFNKLDRSQRDRILGYVEAFTSMKDK
jgi:transcriptional regulator with XRE-family HTH domain